MDRNYYDLLYGGAREYYRITASAFAKYYPLESEGYSSAGLLGTKRVRYVLPPGAGAG